MKPRAGNDESARANVIGGARPRRVGGSSRRVAACLLAAVTLLACAAPPATSEEPGALELTAKRLTLPADQSAAQTDPWRAGALTWLGGLELGSPDRRFGGLSALLISPDGTRVTAVSDRGYRLGFTLRHDAEGRLAGVAAGRIAPLRGPGGARLNDKLDRDAESLARLPDGSMLVGFEHNHRLWRYDGVEEPLSGLPEPLTAPATLSGLDRNSGIEAMSELADGGLLAIAEGQEDAEESPAYLWRDGRWHDMAYRRDGGFRPTAAALLPGGDVLVVERFFSVIEGVRIRLVRVPGAAVQANARLNGEVIATLAPPLPLDNMEGVAVRRGPAGETLIYLISDNNYSALQRTILLQFALRE